MIQRSPFRLFAALALFLFSCQKNIPAVVEQDNPSSTHRSAVSPENLGFALLSETYTFTKLFDILSTHGAQQGLAFGNGHLYVAWDAGSGYGRISQYNLSGTEIKRTAKLLLGHSAEASYRQANGKLYIANGGLTGNPTFVYEVDMNLTTPVIERSLDFSSLGSNGMVAVDNSEGRLLVFGGPNGGPYTVATADFNGTVISKFTIVERLGTPQGIEIIGNEILYYTSLNTTPKSNQITLFTTNGTKLYTIPVPIEGEGQGLAIDESTRTIYNGTIKTNKINIMSPALAQNALLGYNLLLNPNAEGGIGGTSFSTPVPVPFWSATNSTVLIYGKSGLPNQSSPGSGNRRDNYFAGSVFSSGKFTQQVNVANLATETDAASLSFTLGAWLGGYSTQDDNAKITATFLNSSGASLGSKTIGPVLAVDRNSVTGMVQRYATGILPKGTRSILVTITMTRKAGTNCDGFADDISLVLKKL